MSDTKNTLPGYLVSSSGQGLSLTIKGVLLGAIPLIIFLFQLLKVDCVTEAELTQAVEFISQLVAISIVIVGLARKTYYFIKDIVVRVNHAWKARS